MPFLIQEVQGDLAEQREDSRQVADPHAGVVFEACRSKNIPEKKKGASLGKTLP